VLTKCSLPTQKLEHSLLPLTPSFRLAGLGRRSREARKPRRMRPWRWCARAARAHKILSDVAHAPHQPLVRLSPVLRPNHLPRDTHATLSVRRSHRVWPLDLSGFLAPLFVSEGHYKLTTERLLAAGKSDQTKLLGGLAPSPSPGLPQFGWGHEPTRSRREQVGPPFFLVTRDGAWSSEGACATAAPPWPGATAGQELW